jgi:DNA-binding IclR family transcriptional regulator
VESELQGPAAFGPPPRYPIESVDNALRVLSSFRSHDRLRVKDVADLLEVSTGTAHRLLAMLVYRGYVQQDPTTRLYVPGTILLSIGLQAAARCDLRTLAAPLLDQLRAEVDETIQVASLEGTDVLFVDARESSRTLRVTSRAGTLRPAHCTSVGKAMLAEIDRDALLELYPDERLPQATPKSISSRSELLVELESTRARGYAINFGELEDGVGSVAAAVRSRGRPVAAIGAGAPMSRLDDVRITELAEAVRGAADKLRIELESR